MCFWGVVASYLLMNSLSLMNVELSTQLQRKARRVGLLMFSTFHLDPMQQWLKQGKNKLSCTECRHWNSVLQARDRLNLKRKGLPNLRDYTWPAMPNPLLNTPQSEFFYFSPSGLLTAVAKITFKLAKGRALNLWSLLGKSWHSKPWCFLD